MAAGLPAVIQDDDNTYVYGLDLISATDGAGVQTYSLNDGLGSTTDLADGSANPTDDRSVNQGVLRCNLRLQRPCEVGTTAAR